jgi:predicted helicase
MDSFNEIYILDLHGNSLKKEKCPDGSKDENVFDIQQGVAIALFIKKKDRKKENNVHHSEGWGLREKKYEWRDKNDLKTTRWQQLSPKSEFYLFVPKDEKLSETYEHYPKITEIFPLHGVGMTTARDNFVIDMDENALLNRIRLFKNSKYSDDDLHTAFKINKKKGWSIRKALSMLQSVSNADLNKFILPVLYRPFDVRWIFYHDSVVWRTVKKVMQHMMKENIALITLRKGLPNYNYSWVYVTNALIGHGVFYNGNQSTEYVYPLYLQIDADKKDLFTYVGKADQKQPNINPEIFSSLSKAYGKDPTPEEIFFYIYAVLYSNTYRTKYAEFLKIDFPRVPFTKAYTLFSKMAEYGKQLVDLHLLKSPDLDSPVAKFQGTGTDKVEKVKYEDGRVAINKDQYFESVKPEVWQYQIGGYQVCEKWLKDRKGRSLSLEDMKHYCRMVTAIEKTIEIQKVIDVIYPEVEKETISYT